LQTSVSRTVRERVLPRASTEAVTRARSDDRKGSVSCQQLAGTRLRSLDRLEITMEGEERNRLTCVFRFWRQSRMGCSDRGQHRRV